VQVAGMAEHLRGAGVAGIELRPCAAAWLLERADSSAAAAARAGAPGAGGASDLLRRQLLEPLAEALTEADEGRGSEEGWGHGSAAGVPAVRVVVRRATGRSGAGSAGEDGALELVLVPASGGAEEGQGEGAQQREQPVHERVWLQQRPPAATKVAAA
jgi:hypothetical protein